MTANQGSVGAVSATFSDLEAAEAAVSELQGHGIDPSSISLTVQGWTADEDTEATMTAAAGLPREQRGTSNTSRVSTELPNDEDLPTTEAYMTGSGDVPVVLDHDIPPDEPMGGGRKLGIDKTGYDEVRPTGDDMVRRVEGSADADVDIYTDFPDQPGGLSPESTLTGADAQQGNTPEGHPDNSGIPPARGSGATVTVAGDDSTNDFVRGILQAHGGQLS